MENQQYFNLTGKLSVLLSTVLPNTNPELFNWIYLQSFHGKSYEDILKDLVTTGWPESIAATAIQYAREDYPLQHNPNYVAPTSNPVATNEVKHPMLNGYPDNKDKNKILKAPDMPGILFDNYPNTIDVGDKIVDLFVTIDHPRVVVVNNFLSDAECEELISISGKKLQPSKTMGSIHYSKPEQHEARTSSGTFLKKNEATILKTIDNRIAKMLQWQPHLGEDLQILKYEPGQQYKPHYDYFNQEYIDREKKVIKMGQRCGTVLMYLNDVEAGGQTIFPETGINIHPQKGSAMFFSYSDDPSSLSLHGGSPVVQGVKWVATKWLRKPL